MRHEADTLPAFGSVMKTGDTVRDGQGNSYQIGQLLGRGLWGKSYVVRREATDSTHVLKCPLGAEDFKGDVAASDAVLTASREALLEQARLYEQGTHPFLPRLEARFTLPDGQPAIVLPKFSESLDRRIADGIAVGALLDVLLTVAKNVRLLASSGGIHGALRPSNVLFNERGEIFLTDVATPAVRRTLNKLVAVSHGGQPYLPPELTGGSAEPQFTAVADTYALAAMLWRGILGVDVAPDFPKRGLDKTAVVAVKDKVTDRMKQEDSNPRFHGRLAERVGVLLSRALSGEVQPSPPYRFGRTDELQARLEEVASLIRPQVSSVGKVLMDRVAAKPWFDTDESVAFSCTVGCTNGVEGHEEIGVGVAVFDLERDNRLKDLDLGYTVDKHPSGRYRFAFRIGGQNGAVSLAPARYRARIAFAIRDSGQPPATAETEFEIRAAPGWVPPPEAPPMGAIPFNRETTGVTIPVDPGPPEATRVTRVPDARAAEPSRPTEVARAADPAPLPSDSGRITRPGPDLRRPDAPAVPRSQGRNAEPPPPPELPRPADARPPDARPPEVRPAETRPVDPPREPMRVSRPAPNLADAPGAVPVPRPIPAVDPEPPPPPISPPPAAAPVAASPVPAPVAAEPEDEGAYKQPKNWTYEALPRPARTRDVDEDEEPSSSDEPEESDEPGLLERAFHQLKNDPYILVMASLGGIIVVLLGVFLMLRK